MTSPSNDITKPSSSNRDLTDRLIYPLLARLAVLIPARVHPNTITSGAIGCALLGSVILVAWPSPIAPLVCAALLIAWILLDCFDGIHARNTGQSSKLGAFLDHFGDACGMCALHIAIVWRFDIHEPVVFCALLLRQALAAWTYIIQVHAGRLYIPSLGWSFEIYAYAGLLLATVLFPDFRFRLGSGSELDLMSTVLLIYYVAVPLALTEIGLTILRARRRGEA